MVIMSDKNTPAELILVDDFLNINHIPNIRDEIDAHGVVVVSLEFTKHLVKEPFSLKLQLSCNGSNISNKEKNIQLNNMLADINKVVINGLKEHGMVVH